MMNKISNFEIKIIGSDVESIRERLAESETLRRQDEVIDVMCEKREKGESRTKHQLVTHVALPSPTQGVQRGGFQGRG